MSKWIWNIIGFLFLGVAYIGIVTPGIPWSTPSLLASYCFAKGSTRWHNWIMNHKLFGTFLKEWNEKRVYPTKVKWIMFVCMDASLVIIWFTTHNIKLLIGVGLFMTFWMIWAVRYPGSISEYNTRVSNSKRIGWIK